MTAIYLDHASSTPTSPAAIAAMLSWLGECGNPASAHQLGRRARRALEDAREQCAALLHAQPNEIVFTSGATEANNLALFGLVGTPPGRLLGSGLEHPCVTEPLAHLANHGWTLESLAVNSSGVAIVPDPLPADTRLVALQLVNHETGVRQPVEEMGLRLPANVILHCDAAQAIGKVPVSFARLGVTSLVISGHKFGGPVGVGLLVVRGGRTLQPLFQGGQQQQARRPGTESVPLAVGLAAALAEAVTQQEERTAHLTHLCDTFRTQVQSTPHSALRTHHSGVSPAILNMAFPPLRSDALLAAFDLAGVACSAGSACASGSLLASPVLRAMNVPEAYLRSAVRFSFSHTQSISEITEAAERVRRCLERLRQHETEPQD